MSQSENGASDARGPVPAGPVAAGPVTAGPVGSGAGPEGSGTGPGVSGTGGRPDDDAPDIPDYGLLSVVVPVFNERNTVAEIIRRIRAVELPVRLEVVVVDDGSSDGSDKVLGALARFDGEGHPASEQSWKGCGGAHGDRGCQG